MTLSFDKISKFNSVWFVFYCMHSDFWRRVYIFGTPGPGVTGLNWIMTGLKHLLWSNAI